MQTVDSLTQQDALLDVCLVQPESSLTSCSIVQGISEHCVVLLKVEWEEYYNQSQVKSLFPVYTIRNVSGLQAFL
jgi:hypothetical protein